MLAVQPNGAPMSTDALENANRYFEHAAQILGLSKDQAVQLRTPFREVPAKSWRPPEGVRMNWTQPSGSRRSSFHTPSIADGRLLGR